MGLYGWNRTHKPDNRPCGWRPGRSCSSASVFARLDGGGHGDADRQKRFVAVFARGLPFERFRMARGLRRLFHRPRANRCNRGVYCQPKGASPNARFSNRIAGHFGKAPDCLQSARYLGVRPHSVPAGRSGDGGVAVSRGCAALHPWLHSFRPCGTRRCWRVCAPPGVSLRFTPGYIHSVPAGRDGAGGFAPPQGFRCAPPLATFIPSLRDVAGMVRWKCPRFAVHCLSSPDP